AARQGGGHRGWRFDALMRRRVAAALQLAQQQQRVVFVVLDEQYAERCRHPRFLAPSVKNKVAPSSTSACAQMTPPWRWVMRCTVAKPMPVPSNSLAPCSRWKGTNSFSA